MESNTFAQEEQIVEPDTVLRGLRTVDMELPSGHGPVYDIEWKHLSGCPFARKKTIKKKNMKVGMGKNDK